MPPQWLWTRSTKRVRGNSRDHPIAIWSRQQNRRSDARADDLQTALSTTPPWTYCRSQTDHIGYAVAFSTAIVLTNVTASLADASTPARALRPASAAFCSSRRRTRVPTRGPAALGLTNRGGQSKWNDNLRLIGGGLIASAVDVIHCLPCLEREKTGR
jgi:hypothetical protein